MLRWLGVFFPRLPDVCGIFSLLTSAVTATELQRVLRGLSLRCVRLRSVWVKFDCLVVVGGFFFPAAVESGLVLSSLPAVEARWPLQKSRCCVAAAVAES